MKNQTIVFKVLPVDFAILEAAKKTTGLNTSMILRFAIRELPKTFAKVQGDVLARKILASETEATLKQMNLKPGEKYAWNKEEETDEE